VWWEYIIIAGVLLFGIYALASLAGFQTRLMTRKGSRTVESMYDDYADSRRKQRRYARQHGGEWKDDE
jgi:hypothetical protein